MAPKSRPSGKHSRPAAPPPPPQPQRINYELLQSAGTLRTEAVTAWFATAFAALPVELHIPRATALAVHLARNIGVTGVPLATVGALPTDLAEIVATVLFHAAPTWLETQGLADARLDQHPLTAVLDAAAAITIRAGFAFSMSPARADSVPPPRHAGPDARVEEISPSPERPAQHEQQQRQRVVEVADPPAAGAENRNGHTAPRLPRQPSVVIPDCNRRDIAKEVEESPTWSSHLLSTRHGQEPFSPPEREILSALPELCFWRKTEDFDDIRLVVRAVAGAAVRLLAVPREDIERYIDENVRRGRERTSEDAIRPDTLANVRCLGALLHSDADAPDRANALLALAVLMTRVDIRFSSSAAQGRLDRIVAASLAVHPASAKQAAKWATYKLPRESIAAEYDIPLSTPSPLSVRQSASF